MAKQKKKKTSDFYQLPLYKLLLNAGSTNFILSIIILGLLLLIIFVVSKDYFYALLPFFICLTIIFIIVLSIYPVMKSYLFLRQQEKALRIAYKDRDDFHLPKDKREWYIAYCGSSFTLLNRHYIQSIEAITIKENHGDGTSTYSYEVHFIDCNGTSRKFALEKLKSEVKRFEKWYKNSNIKVEEGEDDYLINEDE